MPWEDDFFHTSREELLAVLSASWMTLTNIRMDLKIKYEISDSKLIDGSILIASQQLLSANLIEKTTDARKRTRYRLNSGGSKSLNKKTFTEAQKA